MLRGGQGRRVRDIVDIHWGLVWLFIVSVLFVFWVEIGKWLFG